MLHYNMSMSQHILGAVNLRRTSNPYPVTSGIVSQIDTISYSWFSKGYLPKEVEKYVSYRFGNGLSIALIARAFGVTQLKVTRSINNFIRKMDWVLDEIRVCPRGILAISLRLHVCQGCAKHYLIVVYALLMIWQPMVHKTLLQLKV